MGTGTLVVRADAEQRMGTGHIMRCIALAQEWQETGGAVIFCISPGSRPLEGRIVREGFSVSYIDAPAASTADLQQTLAVIRDNHAAWIVVDGYQFGDDYTSGLKTSGSKVLVIDDYGHAMHTAADIVLNQNAYASMNLYPSHGPATKFLLGTKHMLLRKEFREMREKTVEKPAGVVKNILVTMGGSDPDNVTSTVLDALTPLVTRYGLSVTAIVGRMNAFLSPCKKPVGESGSVSVIHAGDEMPQLIGGADLAITGAGTTAWETAFLGTPMIAVVLSANQEPIARVLVESGAAVAIHDRALVPAQLEPAVTRLIRSAEDRTALVKSAETMIDGEGVSRVVMQMQERPVRLRRARASDSSLLLSWANDPDVRNNAFSQDPIDTKTHEQWFAKKLQSPDCRIWIAVDKDDIPVGQVRFDCNGDICETDVSVAAPMRKKGLGALIISLGAAKTFHSTNIKTITARVKTGNTASKKAFEQAGFVISGTANVKGSEVWQLLCRRPETIVGNINP